MSQLNIVNVGYDSTNYYVVVSAHSTLLVDVGFPGTLTRLQRQCRRMDIDLSSIAYLLCTHYHPDHAGLAQELKRMGVTLLVLDCQLPAIPALKAQVKPQDNYLDIEMGDNHVIAVGESRALLRNLGIEGEIVATPGHSDDSVTLVLDQGIAFTGDLTHPLLAGDDPTSLVGRSWAKLRDLKVRTIYPGHGPVWPIRQFFP
jgi:glyoxylase-like metal-dependent hydrolase (beta-lactamase superfamily II)